MEFHLPSFSHKEPTNTMQPLEPGMYEAPAIIKGAEQVGVTPQAEQASVTTEVSNPVAEDSSLEVTEAKPETTTDSPDDELPTPEALAEPADTDHQIPAQV